MEDKRKYYRNFRAFGGFMLFVGVFANILAVLSTPMTLFFTPIFNSRLWATEFQILVQAIIIVYVDYIGFRIFLKPNGLEFMPDLDIKRGRIIPCILTCLLALVMVRAVWYIHSLMCLELKIASEAQVETGVISALYVVIIAPIIEEKVYRGWLLELLSKYGASVAIIFTAFGFGMIHGNIVQSIPAFFIGLIFGYIAWKYESIVPTIVLHVLTNFLSTIQSLNLEERFTGLMLWVSLAALIIFVIVNRKRIFAPLNHMGDYVDLYFHSIALIIFTILTILLISISRVAL